MTPVERVLAITTALLVLHSASARAQSADAEVLFRDGRTLIKAGKLAEGCDKLAASERLESSVGTLLNLGDCREKLGRLASAWAAFRKAEATAKRSNTNDKREDEARRRAVAVEANMSSLTIEAVQPAPGLVVKRDGEALDPAMIGTAMPIDPGTYVLVAEAPGYAPWKIDVVVQNKTKRRVSVPPLAVSTATTTSAPVQEVRVRRVKHTFSPWRTFSVVLGVAGIGAAGTGFYFGRRANELEDSANQRCPLAVCADPQGLRDNESARDNASRRNILYIAGGAAVASAVALWFVGGPGESTVVTPAISSDHAGVTVLGSF